MNFLNQTAVLALTLFSTLVHAGTLLNILAENETHIVSKDSVFPENRTLRELAIEIKNSNQAVVEGCIQKANRSGINTCFVVLKDGSNGEDTMVATFRMTLGGILVSPDVSVAKTLKDLECQKIGCENLKDSEVVTMNKICPRE